MTRNNWSEYQNRTTTVASNDIFSIEKDWEGSAGLYFKGDYLCDLMGHKWTFLDNGILLKRKGKYGTLDMEESPWRSYILYNNNGKKVFEINNEPKKGEIDVTPKKIKVDIEENLAVIHLIDENGKTEEIIYDINLALRQQQKKDGQLGFTF